ncbi:hypothetical protein [Haloarchaeobius sp. HRN-SO-5]|uniref:DUF7827 domain-containing protein n=1 Tax=Haloarchaeobius sp. HRN-SO-5 TaxID=3446118 RepID=UPI003EB94C64
MTRGYTVCCCLLLVAGVVAGVGGATGSHASEPVVEDLDGGGGTGWSVPHDVTDQPGDVATIPVELGENETGATVVLGNESVGYRLEVRVADADGDGVVHLRWNTYHAGVVRQSAVANRTVSAGPDRVVEARRTTPRRDAHVGVGRFDVTVRNDAGTPVANGTVVLDTDPVRRGTVTVLEGPPLEDPEAALSRAGLSGTVEKDEWLFVVVEQPSIHGYVDSLDDLTGNGTEGATVRLLTADDRTPVSLANATFLHYPARDEFVVGFPPNGSVLEAGRDYRVEMVVAASNPYAVSRLSTVGLVHVAPAGTEPDRAVLEVVDVSTPEYVIEGRNATFEVGVINRGERVGEGTVVVTLGDVNVTAPVTVGPRTRETVTVDVDTGPLTEGTVEWGARAEPGAQILTGTLSIRLTNESRNTDPTLVPGTRDPVGAQPGFDAVAALVGLALGVAGRVRARR